jgi:hypothetical protein
MRQASINTSLAQGWLRIFNTPYRAIQPNCGTITRMTVRGHTASVDDGAPAESKA